VVQGVQACNLGVPILAEELQCLGKNGSKHMNDRLHTMKERLGHELRRFALMFLYLWALLLLFVLDEDIIFRQRGISFSAQGFAIFNALILAKVMLVAEDLDLGRWLQRRPLIYPILHESLLLTALFIGFHVVEHLVIGLVKGESLAASIPHIGGGGLAGLACVAAILFISLLPFFAFKHISREVGESRIKEMLFGTSSKSPRMAASSGGSHDKGEP
jgi:hypothetical protein